MNWELLAKGSRGSRVAQVQTLLNMTPPSTLPPLDVDGDFGSLTVARVMEFQRRNSLFIDGIVGSQTIGTLAFTPDQLNAAAQKFRASLVKCNAPHAVTVFDAAFRKLEDEMIPDRGVPIVLIGVAVAFLVLCCAAVVAVIPRNTEAGRAAAKFLDEEVEKLRRSLNLTPPSELLDMTVKAINKMITGVLTRVKKIAEECKKRAPDSECATEITALTTAIFYTQERLKTLGSPGFVNAYAVIVEGLTTSLGTVLLAATALGKCLTCPNLIFIDLP